MFRASSFLSRVLLADALSCAAAGLLLLLANGFLSTVFGLPWTLLVIAGAALLLFALPVGWLATRSELKRKAVWAVIGVNAVWAVDSVLLLVSGFVEPTPLGQAFVVAQAVAAAVFAELQFSGLRRPAGVAVA